MRSSVASAPILKLKANLPFFKTVLMSYSIDDTIAPTTASGHVPVLLRETLELFGPSRGVTVSYTHPPSPRDVEESRMPSSA